jgi:hypothetical protein
MTIRTSESAWIALIVILALAVGAIAAFLQWLWNSDIYLAAVIAAATFAYAGFTVRLVHSGELDRRERQRREDAERSNILRAVRVELEQNKLRSGETQAWHAFEPFERSALDQSRALRAGLPDEVASALQEVEKHVARYNAVCEYSRTKSGLPAGAADLELRKLSMETDESLSGAIKVTKRHLESGIT